MASRLNGAVYSRLRTLFNVGAIGELTDRQLLERFATDRGDVSELAFAALVERHGPVVLRVCRAVLRDEHEAQDAFQATFLVLVRKAGSLWVRDSLGPWLHQVAYRAATCARSARRRRRAHEREAAETVSARAADEGDPEGLGGVIHEEIERLPERYRAPLVLCDLEGRTHDQAARHLGCPIGTIKSRLARGRECLRARLTRRGLAPSAGGLGVILIAEAASASVPGTLAEATVQAAARLAAGGALAGVGSASASALAVALRAGMRMRTGIRAAAMLIAAGVAVAGVGALARQEPETRRGGASTGQVASRGHTGREPRLLTLKEQLEATRAELDARAKAFSEAKTEAEREAIRQGRLGFYRSVGRLLDLAEASPDDPVACDALLWILGPVRGNEDDGDDWSGLMGRAVDQLLRNHANDPTVARAALALVEGGDRISRNRDKLTRGLYERATAREVKGTACLALAEYLETKAAGVEYKDKPNWGKFYAMMDDGKGGLRRVELPNPYDDAYVKHLRSCDHRVLLQEAEGFYRRIMEEYGDVPYAIDARGAERGRAKKRTLAEVAESRLDARWTLAVGRPAPEIDGADFDGAPLKLSTYRGKVVVLFFWGSWCEPCMREVPHERALVERQKGRPFALLGVDCDENKEAARRAMVREQITWPNWHDGAPGEGTNSRGYHIEGYPATFVLDAEGVIRYKGVLGEGLDQAVETLLNEVESKASQQ